MVTASRCKIHHQSPSHRSSQREIDWQVLGTLRARTFYIFESVGSGSNGKCDDAAESGGEEMSDGAVRIAFLDVGQGDTIVISLSEQREAVVVDCINADAVIEYL